jgi:NhaB family Na+:H+ antiporter
MTTSIKGAFLDNFLGNSPEWYKITIVAFLILNPILFFMGYPFIAGWALILEFIFTLAMALKCYPLQSGGLLAIQAIFIGMATPAKVWHELEINLQVIMLLVFMVAGIYFMKDLLLYVFTKIVLGTRSKILISVMFCFLSAFLSAFLDALTVAAVVMSVAIGFYGIYHKAASGKKFHHEHDHATDAEIMEHHHDNLEEFRGFLRNLLMHAAVGTALGGVCTLVGEPQNVVIGLSAGWDFIEFFWRMSPVTIPVLFAGLTTCVLLEKFKIFNYGYQLPDDVREVLQAASDEDDKNRTYRDKAALVVQGIVGLWLIFALANHLAAVGLIGLTVIVFTTAFTGIVEEHRLGKAFEEALPFTALLVVFFAVVAVISTQGLFTPVIDYVLVQDQDTQIPLFYLANGFLSMISDNVFVGTVYITEVKNALINNVVTRDQFDLLAVAINTGTNIPSVATPNGQAAFLFILTSAVAPLIRLSYGRMVWMALPYTIVMSIVGLVAIMYLLVPGTQYLYDNHYIEHHTAIEAGATPAEH